VFFHGSEVVSSEKYTTFLTKARTATGFLDVRQAVKRGAVSRKVGGTKGPEAKWGKETLG
jgi:hypothetical protein